MSKYNIDITSTPIELCKTFDEISMWREASFRVDQNSGNNFEGILSDIYSEPTHFIFELLQNADDANATKVRFEIKNNKIIFAHNGTRDFSLQDIISITGIGNSTKTKSDQSIGRFGVGFKAVFAITKTPRIWSKMYNFKIENLTVPYKIDARELGGWTTIFELEFASDKYDANEIYQRVIREADSLNIQTILFMRHIRLLEIATDNDRRITLNHSQCDGYSEFSDPADGSKYLVFCGGKNDRTSISYRLDAEGNITKPVNTNVSVFFPTRVNSLLGFVINAPFNTPRTRETIDFTDSYNPILVSETKAVFRRSVLALRDIGLWTSGMIQDIMPINKELREQSDIYDYLFEALVEAFMNENLLPILDNKHELVDKTVIAADSTISKLLVNDNKGWADVSNEDVLLKNYLSNTLGVPTVHFRDFVQLCNPRYLKRQKTSWLYQFYSYCSKQLDKEYVGEPNNQFLRQQPILKSRAGTFVAAYEGDSQNIFLYSKGLDNVRIVDNMFTTQSVEVAQDTRENLGKLLEKLEVKSRSPKSTIEFDYMLRWGKSDFDARKQLFFGIVDIYNESNNDEKDDIAKYLSDKDILYTDDNEWLSEDVYQNTANLRLLLDTASYIHPDFWVVDYQEREIAQKDGTNKIIKKCRGSNELLEALDVCNGFRVTRGEYGMFVYRFANSGNLFKKYGVPAVGGNIRVEFTYEISCFDEILKNIDGSEKSNALVAELLAIPDDKYIGEVGWYTSARASHRDSTYRVPSQFILQLNNSKWIYDKDGKCCSPSEIFEDDFIGLYGIKKNKKLFELIDFKPSFRKSLPPEDIEKLELADKLTIEEMKEAIRQKEVIIYNGPELVVEDDTRTIVLDKAKVIVMSEQQPVDLKVEFNEEVHDYDGSNESEPKVRERVEKVAVRTTDNIKQLLGDYGEIKVLEYLRGQYSKTIDITRGFMADGKKYILLGKTNPGYDIEVSEGDKIIEYIEVKVRTADSGSVIITHNEWEYAKKFGNRYTIYIVSGINDGKAVLNLQKFNDPYKLSTEGSIFLTPDSYRLS